MPLPRQKTLMRGPRVGRRIVASLVADSRRRRWTCHVVTCTNRSATRKDFLAKDCHSLGHFLMYHARKPRSCSNGIRTPYTQSWWGHGTVSMNWRYWSNKWASFPLILIAISYRVLFSEHPGTTGVPGSFATHINPENFNSYGSHLINFSPTRPFLPYIIGILILRQQMLWAAAKRSRKPPRNRLPTVLISAIVLVSLQTVWCCRRSRLRSSPFVCLMFLFCFILSQVLDRSITSFLAFLTNMSGGLSEGCRV